MNTSYGDFKFKSVTGAIGGGYIFIANIPITMRTNCILGFYKNMSMSNFTCSNQICNKRLGYMSIKQGCNRIVDIRFNQIIFGK